VQGNTADLTLFGVDRHSVKWASKQVAYVMATRGREHIEVFAESIADLALIEKHSAERKAAVEMALEPNGQDGRAEVKELFQQLQRIRAAKEPPALSECQATTGRYSVNGIPGQCGQYPSYPSTGNRNLADRMASGG
jgi:hypothetical protein